MDGVKFKNLKVNSQHKIKKVKKRKVVKTNA